MGEQDAVIAGGAEAALTPLGLGGFIAMKAVSSSHNDEPERASRPFDRRRDGFVMAEGAGILVLEELEHYYPGARGYEVAGFFFWQGDKDRYNEAHAAHYEENLVRLIEQLRKDFNAPHA